MEKEPQEISFDGFGYRELDLAGDLLKSYANNPLDCMGDVIKVGFNPNSGNVYLYDEDYNVAMMNGDKLEQFFTCGNCGAEGFADEITLNVDKDDHCSECRQKETDGITYAEHLEAIK